LLCYCKASTEKQASFVKDLRSGRIALFHADTLFPTASMVKIPILIGIMNKIDAEELQYHQQMIYQDSLLYPGIDILGSFKSGEKIELSKLLMLMLTMSDNTASLWLQALAGGGMKINPLLDSMGFKIPGQFQDAWAYGGSRDLRMGTKHTGRNGRG